jgi:hypothetical protein
MGEFVVALVAPVAIRLSVLVRALRAATSSRRGRVVARRVLVAPRRDGRPRHAWSPPARDERDERDEEFPLLTAPGSPRAA